MLNKNTIVRELAATHGLTLKKAAALYSDVLGAVTKSLSEGDSVRLTGFGTLKVVEVSARTVRNPRNNVQMDLPARRRVKFRSAAALKRLVNQ